jgi:hypothetical protein
MVCEVVRVLDNRLIVKLPMPSPQSTVTRDNPGFPTTVTHTKVYDEVEAWIDRTYAQNSEFFRSSPERLFGKTPPATPELDPNANYLVGDHVYVKYSKALKTWVESPTVGAPANLEYEDRYWAIGRAAPLP